MELDQAIRTAIEYEAGVHRTYQEAMQQASDVKARRFFEVLRDEGLIAARQGFGWFVATDPVPHRLERLGTIEAHLEGSGRDAVRRIVEFSFELPPAHVARVFGSGKVPIKVMARNGVVLNIIGALLISVLCYVLVA